MRKDLFIRLGKLDSRAAIAVHQLSGNPIADRFMKFISFTASEYAYPLYAVVLYFTAPVWWKGFLITSCIGFLIEVTIQKIFKYSTKRLRPCEALPGVEALDYIPDRYSFPSGHAGGSFNVAVATTLFTGPMGALMFIWATGASVSRVYNGVHYPGDVLFGALLGSGATVIGFIIAGLLI